MSQLTQELMTPPEAAKWFRRSSSWLRRQNDLQRFSPTGGQPLYHIQVCRAYLLGRLCGLTGEPLRRLQLDALAAVCSALQAAAVAAPAAPETSDDAGK